MLEEIKNNPNITHKQLGEVLNRKETGIQVNVSFLRENGYIERIGSNKAGYWEIIE